MRNTIENLIISLLVFIVGASVGGVAVHKADLSMIDTIMKHQNEVIIEAVNKNTTEVINQHLTEVKKLKLKNSELSNINKDNITPEIETKVIYKQEKKRFRLFKK